MKDGKIVTCEVVIVPNGTGVAGLTTDIPTPTSGVHTLDGMYLDTHVESLPQGVYIVDGRKVIKN